MPDWKARLAEKKILVADGAWGTELAKLGLEPGEAPELWNAERPDEVRSIAAGYVDAGADIVLTNTFGGSPLKLAKSGLAPRADELGRLGAELSKGASAGRALVFASIGPTGEFMEPVGTFSEKEFVAGFVLQARSLAAGGADGFIIETMSDLAEAKAALRAVRDSTDLPAVVSMTFEKGPRGFATMMGVTPERAAEELTRAGADAVGSNCGNGIEGIIEVAGLMRPETELPLWMKPNAGLPELVGGETVFRQAPDEMTSHVEALVRAGAVIIGGCCGTTPEHIRAVAAECRRLAGP